MEMSERCVFHFRHLWDSSFKTAKLVCFSKRGKTEMGTLMQMTCLNKLKTRLIFLNQGQIGLRLAFFYLIMPPATRDERLMPVQHGKCQKGPMRPGATARMVPKCDQE